MPADDPVFVLAVDDQPENLLALEAIFSDPAVQLTKARSGEEALRKIITQEFAVILMDAHMPGMDGFETAALIRARQKSRHTPIIFLTATHKDSLHAATGYDIGAVDYLFKPFAPEVLKAKVAVFVELFKKNKEIQEISKAAAVARDQALEAARFKSEFLASMSHEIRTPMNGILGMIEILIASGLTSDQNHYANTAKQAGQALLSVINDILDFSKIEAGKLIVEVTDFAPIQLVEDVAELLTAQAAERKLSLHTFIDKNVPPVLLGDPVRLRQILMNFVSNAVKFSRDGTIFIKAELESQDKQTARINFSVTDCGIGLTQEQIGKLFKPFVQAENGITREYGGTGLGLSICKKLVEIMNGELHVVSEKGKGSTFGFSVPLSISSNPIIDDFIPATIDGAKALIVDDDQSTRDLVQSYLNAWGVHTTVCTTAEEALSTLLTAATNEPFDFALIDLFMPERSGLQLCTDIKANSALDRLRLILMTAFDQKGIGEQAIVSGFDAYLRKPLRQSQLLNVMTSLIQGRDASKTDDSPGPKEPDMVATSNSIASRTELILLAEDHPINQQVALLLLKNLGFEAHVASDGAEAVEKYSNSPYHLILMDCQMPGMDGFEATRRVRKLEMFTGKHIPIIAMTAHAIEGSRELCIAAGMDDYLCKPVDVRQLKSILNRWLPLLGKPSSSNMRIDIAKLQSLVGEKGANSLLALVPAQAESLSRKLKAALEEHDARQIAFIAHGMKSVFGTLCAEGMCLRAGVLEDAAIRSDWESIEEICADLQDCITDNLDFTRKLLADQSS